jgi:hypothetical protein
MMISNFVNQAVIQLSLTKNKFARLLQMEGDKETDEEVSIVVLNQDIGVEKCQYDRVDALIIQTLDKNFDTKSFSSGDAQENCQEIADRCRKMLWPERFWWVIQKIGAFARPYHAVRYKAMES